MKTNNPNEKLDNAPTERSAGRPVRVVAWTLGLAALVLVGVFVLGRGARTLQEKQSTASQGVSAASLITERPVRPHREVAANEPTPPARKVYQQPEPTPAMRQLVGSLVNFDSAAGGLSVEQCLTWRTNFLSLIQQGANAVPAITEFLAKNVDLAFSAEDQG